MWNADKDGGWVSGLSRWLLQRRSAWLSPRDPRRLELLETLPLGGRRQLALVRCGEEEILVGLGGDSVQSMVRMRRRGCGQAEDTSC